MTADERMPGPSDEIDLLAVASALWSRKYLIGGTTIICALVAAVLALTATPMYRAETVVTEAEDEGMGGAAGSLTNEFGGLASLVGVNLGTSSTNQEARALLRSRRLAEDFVMQQNLLAELLPNAKEPPTLWFAVKKFRESVLSIREEVRAGTTIVEIEWSDPQIAARWANDFVSLVNEHLRTRALSDAKRNIEYLNEQITHTNIVELQRVMYNLVENETKTLMLANARVEYAFTVVDPAVAPEQRVSPRRSLMVLVGALIGMFIGVVAVGRLTLVAKVRATSASTNA